MGYSLVNVQLWAKNTNSQQTSFVNATLVPANKTWTATLSLTAGTYEVWGVINTVNNNTLMPRQTQETPHVLNVVVTN
jgi:hypothetical protein